MCNSCSCGCQQSMYSNCEARRCEQAQRYGCQAWMEAEEMMMEHNRRRCREDRCARQFVRCMQCHREY